MLKSEILILFGVRLQYPPENALSITTTESAGTEKSVTGSPVLPGSVAKNRERILPEVVKEFTFKFAGL